MVFKHETQNTASPWRGDNIHSVLQFGYSDVKNAYRSDRTRSGMPATFIYVSLGML